MLRQLFGLFIPLLLLLLLDIFILKSGTIYGDPGDMVIYVVYGLIAMGGYIAAYLGLMSTQQRVYPRSPWTNFLSGFSFSVIVTKLFLFLLFLIYRGIAGLLFLLDHPLSVGAQYGITVSILIIGVVLLIYMMYGVIRGKYRYTVEPIELRYAELPEEFDGLRIVQISDVHAGTWDDVDQVAKGIDKINALRPDLILFTGDLVNSDQEEIAPYMHLFAGLSAPMGKYAVLGNHDYYGVPRDVSRQSAYWSRFQQKYDQMGFQLLLNEATTLSKDNGQLYLLGVENWGSGRYFPKRGDLDKTLYGVDEGGFKILMSHDPSHWDVHVKKATSRIHLTLSGHTHGMQFGINTRWWRWSPIQYRYRQWMGLYEENGRRLYVNRGFGILGFPGRVGMYPEITLLTLKK